MRSDPAGEGVLRVRSSGCVAEAIAQETFWAIRRFVEALARRGPLLIVIDDLQWAEPTLLDLLEYLADRLGDTPLLMLCLARPELMESRPGWGDDERGSTIHLGPLVDTESQELLSNLLGGAIASDISRELVRVAEGNPLFLEESVSVLVEKGLLRPSDGKWISATDVVDLPLAACVHAVLAARLDGLDWLSLSPTR